MSSPVLANLYLHYALDGWFAGAAKPCCRGEAHLCRHADHFVCALRLRGDAERFFKGLPQRLAKFRLEVAPETTQVLRFNRFHPSTRRRATFLGFELYCIPEQEGTPRGMQRIKDWIKSQSPAFAGQGFCLGLGSTAVGAL